MTQTVLAIDDSQDIHDLLSVRLRPEPIVLHHALDAATGLRMANELSPDLILLDVDMPITSGFEVCQVLKSTPATVAIPVIFLTGAHDLETKVKGFELGAVDYVTKPFEPAELRARVRAALRTKRYQDLLAARAHIDALTGLGNRARFDGFLVEQLAAATRYGRIFSVAMIDIDHFKRLNDSHGHPFGDQVLQHVADCLSEALRPTDTACRYGGEEFAIIFGDTGLDGAFAAIERARERVGALRLAHKGAVVSVSASYGVASSEQIVAPDVLSRERIVELADGALYAAKNAGRDRICRAEL